MALRIRLSRGGAKKKPHYKIVVIESTQARDAKYVEQVGHYHPCDHSDKRLTIDKELFLKWTKFGAKPSETVERLWKSL